ncbi:MAG TPA: hypothetical protein VMV05_12605 [bacterium]|nr:hypothetical protein [bacterium]
MRLPSPQKFPLLFAALIALGTGPLQGTEMRVDTAGNLTSVLDDETANLDLFLDGNPAGLAFLATHDRLDLSAQWALQAPTSGPDSSIDTTVPRIGNDDPILYEGLMFFPSPDWSFQVAGDLLSSPVVPIFAGDSLSKGRYRSMVRSAFRVDGLALGLEFFDIQTDRTLRAGQVKGPVNMLSGDSRENELRLRTGAALRVAGGEDKDSPLLDIGAVFATHMAPDVQDMDEKLSIPSFPDFILHQSQTATQFDFFGPELHYEIPGRLVVRFNCFVTETTTGYDQRVSATSAAYPNASAQWSVRDENIDSMGAFHLVLPLESGENLRLGGNLEVVSDYSINLNQAQFVYADQNTQHLNGRIGIGLENPGRSTWGVQFTNRNFVDNSQTGLGGTADTADSDFEYFKFVFGGEQEVAGDLFLRASLSAEFDNYGGTPDTRLWVPLLTFGPGLVEKSFKLDMKCYLGETLDRSSGALQSFLAGIGLAGSFFL